MRKIVVLVILTMFFVSLKSQQNYRMEFTLNGSISFDSLRVVAYDNTKNEIIYFPCRLTHSNTWINEIPDSIWNTNEYLYWGKVTSYKRNTSIYVFTIVRTKSIKKGLIELQCIFSLIQAM